MVSLSKPFLPQHEVDRETADQLKVPQKVRCATNAFSPSAGIRSCFQRNQRGFESGSPIAQSLYTQTYHREETQGDFQARESYL